MPGMYLVWLGQNSVQETVIYVCQTSVLVISKISLNLLLFYGVLTRFWHEILKFMYISVSGISLTCKSPAPVLPLTQLCLLVTLEVSVFPPLSLLSSFSFIGILRVARATSTLPFSVVGMDWLTLRNLLKLSLWTFSSFNSFSSSFVRIFTHISSHWIS